MSFKTGGLKAVYAPICSSYEPSVKFTVYTANNSTTDDTGYKVYDESGNEVDITEYWEQDCAKGRESLIDVLYHLKHNGPGIYSFGSEWQNITIEEMTSNEMDKVFGN